MASTTWHGYNRLMHISKDQYNQLEELRQQQQLQLILLHGSQSDCQTNNHSDVDIAVYGPRASIDSLQLISQLAAIFGTDQIDLTNLNTADPLLLKTVTQKAKLLAGSQNHLNIFELKAFHRYIDYQPYLKMEQDLVRERVGL